MPTMRKLVVVALILTVFVVLGCINAGEEVSTTTIRKITPTTQPKAPDTTLLRGVAEFRRAIGEGNVDKCKELEDNRLKDICIRDIAISKNDADICDKVSIDSLKDTCYYRIAVSKKNKALCDRIEMPQVKDACNQKA